MLSWNRSQLTREMEEPKPRKPNLSLTPSGAVTFWLSLFAIPSGAFLYSGPMVILGLLGLISLLITKHLAAQQLTQLHLQRRLPRRGFPGETFEVETNIGNARKSLISREIDLNDKLAGHGGSAIKFASVAPGQTLTRNYPAKVFQRGRLQIPHYTLSSRWPFGFFEATLSGHFESRKAGDDTMLVAPKPTIPSFVDQILQQIEQEAALFSELNPDDPTEFRSLRKFRSGDSVKSIHWPASSRSDSIIVREFDPPRPKPQCHGILLHQFVPPGEMNQPDRFEKILRIASGLLVRFWQRDLPVVMRIEFPTSQIFRIPEQHHYHEALDALAEAISNPATKLDHLDSGWECFEDCDQVFVLCDGTRNHWQPRIEGKHPALICIDPETGGFQTRKTARTIKPAGKILTR